MQRNPLFQHDTQTETERRDEADRLFDMLSPHIDEMTRREREFVEGVGDGREITPRMLFWLRDIKDKYAV